MLIEEIRDNLNKKVRYSSNKHYGLDGEYIFRACIIRKNERGAFCQAEIQQEGSNSVLITRLDDIQAVGKEGNS